MHEDSVLEPLWYGSDCALDGVEHFGSSAAGSTFASDERRHVEPVANECRGAVLSSHQLHHASI